MEAGQSFPLPRFQYKVPFTIRGCLYWEEKGESPDEKGNGDNGFVDNNGVDKVESNDGKIGEIEIKIDSECCKNDEPFRESLELYVDAQSKAKQSNIIKSVFDFTSRKTRDSLSDYQKFLAKKRVDVHQLASLAWNGVPPELRLKIWCILLDIAQDERERTDLYLMLLKNDFPSGYEDIMSVPENEDEATLDDIQKSDKALEFGNLLSIDPRMLESVAMSDVDCTESLSKLLRQIAIDAPRSCIDIPYAHIRQMQRMVVRIMYVWSIETPEVSYLQGMIDIISPFIVVALSSLGIEPLIKTSPRSIKRLDRNSLLSVESYIYSLSTVFLTHVLPLYTDAQPGVSKMINLLDIVLKDVDKQIYKHLSDNNIPTAQFAYRWMCCLLVRELPPAFSVRLYDAYLSESVHNYQSNTHGLPSQIPLLCVFVSCAMLIRLRKGILTREDATLFRYLQEVGGIVVEWGADGMEELLAEALVIRDQWERGDNNKFIS